MKAWMKYLIIGWSIVSVGIVIVSFQLMKLNSIEESHSIMLVYKAPEKPAPTGNVSDGWEVIAEDLFYNKNGNDLLSPFDPTITKKEFVDKMKKAKGITIESKSKVKDNSIYLWFPIYSFLVWGVPILVFSLVGLLFSRKSDSK